MSPGRFKPATSPGRHTPQDEFQTASRWVTALRFIGEQRYARLRELVVRLDEPLENLQQQGTVLLHRDFFAGQMLRSPEALGLLDLDTLSLGHAEVDVATFLAHLFLDGLKEDVSRTEVLARAAAFVEAYRQSGGCLAKSRLRFYLPCALARLGAIHLARGVPTTIVEELWGLADGYLAGSWRLD